MENVSQSVPFPVYMLIRSEFGEELTVLVPKARQQRAKLKTLFDKLTVLDGAAIEAAKTSDPQVPTIPTSREADAVDDEFHLLKTEHAATMAEVKKHVTDKMRKELSFFGAETPDVDVDVHMKLGAVLLDLYLRMNPEPTPPLSKLVWKKRNMELAECLEKADVVVPEWAKPFIQKAMMDDQVWSHSNLSVWVNVKVDGVETPMMRFFGIKAEGSKHFTKVMEAAAEAVYSPELLK